MWNLVDPIIDELHEIRRSIAKRFDYDVHRIAEDARRRQEEVGKPVWRPGASEITTHPSGEAGNIDNG